MFDYKFPTIEVSKKSSNKSDVNFYILNDKLIKNKSISEKVKIYYSSLKNELENKDKFSIKVFNETNKSNVICYVPEYYNKIENDLAKALADFSSNKNSIELFLGKCKIDDKKLISQIMLNLKKSWNLKSSAKKMTRKHVYIVSDNKIALKYGSCLAITQSFVQQLVNMPSNLLTPTLYAKMVEEFIRYYKLNSKLKFTAHDKKFLEKEKMGSFLAVAKGSSEQPLLLVLEYTPSNKKPLVLVGKGITFDSGGISIKPSTGMDAMKGDMAGSASAIGATLYAAMTNSQMPVVAIAPCCENMPSGNSVKPGDVVIASNGLSIEVVDTDAEGRLVLADALNFSKKYDAKYTIDLATLTGACVVALGSTHSGLFTEDSALEKIIIDASKSSGDKVWSLPLDEEHESMLESKIADISNLCLGRGAGASNGAIFLKKFAPKESWCHLDIAGTATPKGVLASGRPMPLLTKLIDNLG